MTVYRTRSGGTPEFDEIAAHLAAIADVLPGPSSPARDALRQVAQLMSGSRSDVDASLGAVVQALPALVVPPCGLRDEPETWMLYACMLLLGHERMRRKTVVTKESPQRRH